MVLPILVKELREAARLETVRFQEGIALLDEAVLLDDVGLGAIELADRVLELALEVGDGLSSLEPSVNGTM